MTFIIGGDTPSDGTTFFGGRICDYTLHTTLKNLDPRIYFLLYCWTFFFQDRKWLFFGHSGALKLFFFNLLTTLMV